MTLELVARWVVGAAGGGLLVTGLTVLVLERKRDRPGPVERDTGPLASVNFVGILGFVGVGLGTAVWGFGTVARLPGWIEATIRGGGILLVWAAGLLAAWGLWSIGRQMSSQAEVRPDTALVTSGAFRVVRHPLYLSILLLWAGGTLALQSWLMAACTAALVPLFVARSRLEERMLLRHFGDAYAAYMRRVPLLLPGHPRRRPRSARDAGLHPMQ
jgi:protein-S-isoprenylcysteine O-methyltransferase Ste14